ncbi:MAG: cyclase family protein [Candidatus Hydrogenedentes bacterium]|nr:cyclase family protein [Candidatus Hydrogenedentota bacterium]
MGLKWVDVSIPMREGMTVWPGDPPYSLSPRSRIAAGAGCNVSCLSFSTHTGTHVDAPWHFEEGGKRLHEMDTSVFFGDALLIETEGASHIGPADLGPAALPSRVLLKTRNSTHGHDAPFMKDYVAVEREAAERMVDEGVRLVGVDYLSVAPYKQEGQETHHILLRANVLVVEGLRLGSFSQGTYPFVVLPLPLVDADGAPCRAFLGREE